MILRALGQTSSSELGAPMGLGCQRCELLEMCGGTTDFDCYAHCCGNPAACSLACPRAHRFSLTMQDAGGMSMRGRYAIQQRVEKLPIYIPHVHNGSCREGHLSTRFAALTTFDVSAPDSECRFNGPSHLREQFGLSEDARILLLSVAKDNRLEHHWRYSESLRLAQYLAILGISHVTAPNFSFALNEPRPEHLVNRSRSLLEAERLTGAGLSVIPHVNAFNQKDWNCWRDFLRDHPHLSMVCQEFQTGLASGTRARWHVYQLRNIEQLLGRGLQLIAVGGRRHLHFLIELSAVTIIDANPFVKTHMRRRLVDGKWLKNATAEGEPLDQLMEGNIEAYTKYVEARMAALKEFGSLPPRKEIPAEPLTQTPIAVSALQLPLWPELRASA
ncbi:MAG: DUF4417 domain-containing protein [Silvibacterium sp.]